MSFESLTIPVEDERANLSILQISHVSENIIIQQYEGNKNRRYFCTSMKPDQEIIFNLGSHPVFDGFVWAYQNHRPITISPDIIWTLIIQAFSNHVSSKPEELRSLFVNFDGQKELFIKKDNLNINTMSSEDWEQNFFPEFVEQITQYTGKSIIDTLTPDFTTTTPVSLAVGQLTIMSTMKHYFKYVGSVCGCGLPYVTIEGSVEDWQKVHTKLSSLEKYKFDWFTKEISPIIEKIIQTKKGNVDKQFWKDMIRVKNSGGFYNPNFVDGWFTKFFPFSNDGSLNDGFIAKGSDLQNEIQNVPFTLKIVYPNQNVWKKCELWAGFVGLTQNKENGSIKPEIGWCIISKI